MLRPHQDKAIEMCREARRLGHKKMVLAAPCSFGKTRVAVEILKNVAKNGKHGIFICDRVKLVDQALAEFDRAGIKVGVIQSEHYRTDPNAQIQIASIQTLARRKRQPFFHVAIVDECHTHYDSMTELMKNYSACTFIGLSATPYSKGLGNYYSKVLVPITPRELLSHGYLCPVKYYGGDRADLKKVKTRRMSTGTYDYDPKSLSKVIEEDQKLVGDIVENFKRYGKGQTIAFSPSIKHSKKLVEMFELEGISAVHIDGYMDLEERQIIFEGHDAGDFQILSCSRLLNTGYDAPKVETLIDCFPTKSLITYVQRAGRIMRTAKDKDFAVYLDHSGNVEKHGFAEDIVPETLDKGQKNYSERSLTKEKKDPNLSPCPQCYQVFVPPRCACGYELPPRETMRSDTQILKEITMADKAKWLGELKFYAKQRGYKPGWASWAYREKFKVWPRVDSMPAIHISDEVKGFIKHMNIKRAKSVKRHTA